MKKSKYPKGCKMFCGLFCRRKKPVPSAHYGCKSVRNAAVGWAAAKNKEQKGQLKKQAVLLQC